MILYVSDQESKNNYASMHQTTTNIPPKTVGILYCRGVYARLHPPRAHHGRSGLTHHTVQQVVESWKVARYGCRVALLAGSEPVFFEKNTNPGSILLHLAKTVSIFVMVCGMQGLFLPSCTTCFIEIFTPWSSALPDSLSAIFPQIGSLFRGVD